MCRQWHDSFENFLLDMGEKPKGTRLCRIDLTRGYEPDNCVWRPIMQSYLQKLEEDVAADSACSVCSD